MTDEDTQLERKTLKSENIPKSNHNFDKNNNGDSQQCCVKESSSGQKKSLIFFSNKSNICQIIIISLLFLVIYNLVISGHSAGQLSEQYFQTNASQSLLHTIEAQNVSDGVNNGTHMIVEQNFSDINNGTRIIATQNVSDDVNNGTHMIAEQNVSDVDDDTHMIAAQNFSDVNNVTESLQSNYNVTMIIQLSGELGNHLSKIAKGFGIVYWLQNEIPNLNITIQFRRQVFNQPSIRTDKKWKNSEYELHKCFPQTQLWNFSQANTPEISYIIQKLQENEQYKYIIKNLTKGEIVEGTGRNILEQLVNITELVNENNNQTLFGNDDTKLLQKRIVVLYIDDFSNLDYYVDRYYDEFRQLFDMNHSASCCNIIPYDNEIVFHFRNFAKETPKRVAFLGLDELTPTFIYQAMEQIPTVVGERKVAIITRHYTDNPFDNVDTIKPFVDILNKLGYEARILDNQTAIEDFCFLKSSQRDVLGLARSTFFLWASLLSDYDSTSIVQAYSINSTSKRSWSNRTGNPIVYEYNWTNPKLKNRFLFPLFKLDQ